MNLPLHLLDYGGLFTLVSTIKSLFATKDELLAFGGSQTILNHIDAAVDQRIQERLNNGDIHRVQASITDDGLGNVSIEFSSIDDSIQSYVATKIEQSIQSGEIGRLQASIMDDGDGAVSMSFDTASS